MTSRSLQNVDFRHYIVRSSNVLKNTFLRSDPSPQEAPDGIPPVTLISSLPSGGSYSRENIPVDSSNVATSPIEVVITTVSSSHVAESDTELGGGIKYKSTAP